MLATGKYVWTVASYGLSVVETIYVTSETAVPFLLEKQIVSL